MATDSSWGCIPRYCHIHSIGAYLDILENPSRPNQSIFVLDIEGYVWVVPFVMDSAGDIVLKTAYPSRKMNKRYGGKDA